MLSTYFSLNNYYLPATQLLSFFTANSRKKVLRTVTAIESTNTISNSCNSVSTISNKLIKLRKHPLWLFFYAKFLPEFDSYLQTLKNTCWFVASWILNAISVIHWKGTIDTAHQAALTSARNAHRGSYAYSYTNTKANVLAAVEVHHIRLRNT